jgi:hypothetical protein
MTDEFTVNPLHVLPNYRGTILNNPGGANPVIEIAFENIVGAAMWANDLKIGDLVWLSTSMLEKMDEAGMLLFSHAVIVRFDANGSVISDYDEMYANIARKQIEEWIADESLWT